MKKPFTLIVEESSSGIWFITSEDPDINKVFIASKTLDGAFAAVSRIVLPLVETTAPE